MKTNEKIGINLHQSHCSTVPEITALLFPNLLHFIFPKSLYFFFLFTGEVGDGLKVMSRHFGGNESNQSFITRGLTSAL